MARIPQKSSSVPPTEKCYFQLSCPPSSKNLGNGNREKQKRWTKKAPLRCTEHRGHRSSGDASAAASGLRSHRAGTLAQQRRTGETPCSASRMSTSSEIITRRDNSHFSHIGRLCVPSIPVCGCCLLVPQTPGLAMQEAPRPENPLSVLAAHLH